MQYTVLKQKTKLGTTSTFFISHLPNLKVNRNEEKIKFQAKEIKTTPNESGQRKTNCDSFF